MINRLTRMLSICSSILLLAATLSAQSASEGISARSLDACDVVWSTPGKTSEDSMPLGNGDIGLNVWTEANGDIVFYVSKTDTWSEKLGSKSHHPKVGRVRLSLLPNGEKLTPDFHIKQVLRFRTGEIHIEINETKILIWVDANHPVVHVNATSSRDTSLRVTLDPWRTEASVISADTVVDHPGNRLQWYHSNGRTGNPLTDNLTFGAAILGENLKRKDSRTLESAAPSLKSDLSIHVLTAVDSQNNPWANQLDKQVQIESAAPSAIALEEHKKWWAGFWNRSWIFLSGPPEAAKITQGYICQRFLYACAGRGAYPIKFNGSIFTVDHPTYKIGKDKNGVEQVGVNADYRVWGEYTFQNTRLIYWPMLAAGDFEMMLPLFQMYQKVLSKNAELVKKFYKHEGSYFMEYAGLGGGIQEVKPTDKASFFTFYFSPVLELSAMMLDFYDYTRDKAFARDMLLPMVEAGLTFFEQHFPRDASGKLLLDKDNAIEMFWGARNGLPDIAGLHYDLTKLLALPDDVLAPARKAHWQKLKDILPPVPTGNYSVATEGKNKIYTTVAATEQPVILPFEAGQTHQAHNGENAELYAIFPFRLYGVRKPEYEMALRTFERREFKSSGCWRQDPVQSALLGLTDQAAKNVTTCLTRSDPEQRFPGFWVKGNDYSPDMDNGGNGQLALQLMLMQTEDRKIYLLPAWPKEWNADFRLHAPLNTVVTGRVEAGKIVKLDVTPPERRADVINLNEPIKK